MKLKIFLVALLLIFIFCVVGKASAITDAEKQALILQIQQQLASLEQQLIQIIVQRQGGQAWCYTFNNNLGYANSGSIEVVNLHIALQKQGIFYYPDDAIIYSLGTSQAVKQFQAKYGISPQSGYVGPKTRTQLNQTYGCSATTTYYNNSTNNNSNYNTFTTNANSCQAACATNSSGVLFAVDCSGNPRQCSSGQTCKLDYNATNKYVNGVVQTTQNLNGSECVGSSSNVTNNSNNNCNASCVTQSDGIYTIDCYGNVTKCSSGQTCQQTYSTSYTNNNGSVQTVKTLTGSECVTSSTATTPTPTTCSYNSDCGSDGLTGSLFCQYGNVYQNYTTYTCNNPSTSYSSCSNSTLAQIKNSCPANQTCSGGSCVDNPNNNIVCSSDSQCGANGYTGDPFCQTSDTKNVYQNYITYTCNNPGTTSSSCSNSTAAQVLSACASNQICINSACVTQPLPTIDIKANGSDGPVTVISGRPIVLSWTSTSATSCSASGRWYGTKSTSGSEIENYAGQYYITCAGLGGTATDSVIVIFSH